MQQISRKKAYKASAPLNTINKIRSQLAMCDLFTTEYHLSYPVPKVYCCRVKLADPRFSPLNIGSNGKGLDPRYSLASAYGEIMERLQNSVLFPIRQLRFSTRKYLDDTPSMEQFRERLEERELILEHYCGPDEVYLNTSEIVNVCSDVLAKMLSIQSLSDQKDYLRSAFEEEAIACLPYYSVFGDTTRLLPQELIWYYCGTNGMCAGNTPEEALNQGISEIFERYAIRMMYHKQLTPPTIPKEYFSGSEVFFRIRNLEATGLEVEIKDCSLGLGLPVVGLMLKNMEKNSYVFQLGADPSPITALERCLTEIFQGTPEQIANRYTSLSNHEQPQDAFALRGAYYANIISGWGVWPNSIFADQSSYPFTGFENPESSSDEDDLAYLVEKVRQQNHDLYIRDVSFLGMPTYHVYIPGLSETDFIFEKQDFLSWMEIVRKHRTILNLKSASTENIAQLAEAIQRTAEVIMPTPFEPGLWFVSNTRQELQQLPRDLLLTMLFSRIGDYKSAAASLEQLFGDTHTNELPLPYYRAVHSYLQGKANDLPDPQIRDTLNKTYGEALAKQVIQNFADSEQVLEQTAFSTCFDCDVCTIQASCRYFDVLEKVKFLQKLHQENLPTQGALAGIFRWQLKKW